MMDEMSSKSERDELEEASQVQHWVRRYAQNRSLGVVVSLALFVLLWLAISLPSYWGGMAYRDGNYALLALCIGVLVVALVALFFFSAPRWGGKLIEKAADKLYAGEGRVTISVTSERRRRLGAAIGAPFGICVLGSVILGFLGYLPTGKYMQPVSAVYVVPFLIALNLLMRPAVGNVGLLWPLLYGLHALLIVAGAPIVFVEPWDSLNMVLPIVGYGLLTSLVSHLYSRWALHNIRAIVSQQLDRAELVEEGDHT
jgi:hypothetical protein